MKKYQQYKSSVIGKITFLFLVSILAICLNAKFTNETYAATIETNNNYAALVYDVNSSLIIYGRNIDKKRYPASLTKVMTLYILFSELEKNNILSSTRMKISKKAARQPKTRLGLKPNTSITVTQAVKALIVKSANDVAVVVAEHIAGSVRNFAKLMNKKAKDIGMHKTHFFNPSGLPNKKQTTTARDMIILAKRIMIDFPEYYHLFSLRNFSFRGKNYASTNRLLKTVKGIEGLKTGYTNASGYNIINSYRKENYHLIAIVMGGKTRQQRDEHMKRLIRHAIYNEAGRKLKLKDEVNKKFQTPPKNIPFRHAVDYDTTSKLKDVKALLALLKAIENKGERKKYSQSKQSSKDWHIQIGAYKSKNIATKTARKLIREYPDIFNGRNTYIMETNNGLYRARITSFNATEARSVCNILKNKGVDCIHLKQL